jgi:hypothetical protein
VPLRLCACISHVVLVQLRSFLAIAAAGWPSAAWIRRRRRSWRGC